MSGKEIDDLVHAAWRVHWMAEALDVVSNAQPAGIPEGVDQIQRQALNALPFMIEQMIEMTEALAGRIDKLSRDGRADLERTDMAARKK